MKDGKTALGSKENIASWEQCSIICGETAQCDSYVYHTKEFQTPAKQKVCNIRASADTDRTGKEVPGLVAGFTAGKCPQKG